MLVALVATLAVTVGILAACLAVAERTIRGLKTTVRIQAATERRLASNVRTLQEELVHHAAEAQVITLWRGGHQMTTRGRQ